MREILFRGKKFNGEWIEGDLFHVEKTVCIGGKSVPMQYVDPNTVGQYTGLNDMDGKRIFEGDIVQWKDEGESHDLVVAFRNGAFVCLHPELDIEPEPGTLYAGTALGLKVVGNIYE